MCGENVLSAKLENNMIKGQVTLEDHEIDFEVIGDPEFLKPDIVRYTVKTDLRNGSFDIEVAECDAVAFMMALGATLQYDSDRFSCPEAIEKVASLTKRRWVA